MCTSREMSGVLICRFDFDFFDFGQGQPPTFDIYVLEDDDEDGVLVVGSGGGDGR